MFSMQHWKVKVIRAFLFFKKCDGVAHIDPHAENRKNNDHSKNISMF